MENYFMYILVFNIRFVNDNFGSRLLNVCIRLIVIKNISYTKLFRVKILDLLLTMLILSNDRFFILCLHIKVT